MIDELTVLKEARAFLSDYDNWRVGVGIDHRRCALGAIVQVYGLATYQAEAVRRLNRVCYTLHGVLVVTLNDSNQERTEEVHQAILDLFDEAIRQAQEELSARGREKQ